jgi:hypothetical protein
MILTVAVIVLCPVLAAEARAACFSTPVKRASAASTTQFAVRDAGYRLDGRDQPGSHDIVGLWHAEFFLGNGPDRYDESFQQFHVDHTEQMISNGVPPVLGNVCVGLWKQDGQNIVLKHVTWNWDAEGHLTGTFVMMVTLRVGRDGNSYSGRWSADSFDVAGHLLDAHAEGIVQARRITLD